MKQVFALIFAGLAVVSWNHAAELNYTSILIPVRDSNTLAADLWYSTPTPEAKPVILVQTPYNRKLYRLGTLPGFAGGAGFPVSTNYNYVIVDWRGFYDSEPAGVPGYNRGLDGYDCVEWIATQTWSNARIGTWGSSALGHIQYLTAFENPPHLVCCTIQVKDFQNRYDNYYYGGDYRKEHVETMASLGLTVPSVILSHPTRDTFWILGENRSNTPEDLRVPALIVGGWFDHFPDAILRSFSDLRAHSDPLVRDKHRLIVGPWTHGGLGREEQGILTFPDQTNLWAKEIRFWDYTMRDMTNNGWAEQPVVDFFQMGENIWMDGPSWEADYFRTLARDGTGDFDGDGMSDRDEYIAGTDPTDSNSVLRLRMLPAEDGFLLEWRGKPERFYRLLRTDDLVSGSVHTQLQFQATAEQDVTVPVPTEDERNAFFWLRVRWP